MGVTEKLVIIASRSGAVAVRIRVMSSTNGAGPVVEADDAGSSSPPLTAQSGVAGQPPQAEAEAFFMRHYAPVCKMLRMRGARQQEAEDAASEAICAAIQAWATVDDPARWVYTAALYSFFNYRRSVKGEVLTDGMMPIGPPATDELGEVEARELEQQLLAGVTPAQREVMELLIEGRRPHEVAVDTGISGGAVRAAAMRARATLKAALRAEGITDIPRQRKPRLNTGTDATAEESSTDV